MVRSLFALRYITLVAALGAVLGALLMFWQGGAELLGAAKSVGDPESKGIAAYVIHATDAMLFGVVLIIFAYAIVFGFVLDLSAETRQSLPTWMHVESIRQLKQSLIEVILIYMIVDVATDWAETETHLTWSALVKPMSIILIAGAMRLLARPAETDAKAPGEGGH
jgi:uncharacterized membrane protein YqhA